MITAFLTGIVTGLVLLVAGFAWRLGQSQEKTKHDGDMDKQDHAARRIRDRLDHDAAERQRVRDHFTR